MTHAIFRFSDFREFVKDLGSPQTVCGSTNSLVTWHFRVVAPLEWRIAACSPEVYVHNTRDAAPAHVDNDSDDTSTGKISVHSSRRATCSSICIRLILSLLDSSREHTRMSGFVSKLVIISALAVYSKGLAYKWGYEVSIMLCWNIVRCLFFFLLSIVHLMCIDSE